MKVKPKIKLRWKDPYWGDVRWKQVEQLRKVGKLSEANNLLFEIRASWGVE